VSLAILVSISSVESRIIYFSGKIYRRFFANALSVLRQFHHGRRIIESFRISKSIQKPANVFLATPMPMTGLANL
jgi:hypothetical protein